MKVNPRAILKDVDHRPYLLPKGSWIMTQSWHELLFAHWPITPELLRPLVPSLLPLDTFEGQAWVGIIPFRVSNARPRWFPQIPWLSQFPELNVRTYVTLNGIPGVYFFSLDVGNAIDVVLARLLFHLPYFHARMHRQNVNGTIHYSSHRSHSHIPSADFVARYRPTGPIFSAQRDTLEYWLTERYCLYTNVKQDRLYRLDIHHRQWPLQPAELETTRNTMALADGIDLPHVAPLLHYAHEQDVLFWPLHRILYYGST